MFRSQYLSFNITKLQTVAVGDFQNNTMIYSSISSVSVVHVNTCDCQQATELQVYILQHQPPR